jgi:galacturonokinase
MSTDIENLKAGMYARFGIGPSDVQIVRAPYRICPLGAHIDHQLGPVTAMAIDQAVFLAFAPSGDAAMRLQSLTFDGDVQFDLGEVPDKKENDWGNFARGAVRAMQNRGLAPTRGIVGLTAGRMNEGGLSSSAAIGVAFLLALQHANQIAVTPKDNILLDQAIENDYLGLKNGILDQSAILLSRNNHLTLIDCELISHELIPKPQSMPPFDILVAQSGLKDVLVGTGYNTRVDECAQAASILLTAVGRTHQKPLLGNISPEEYDKHKGKLAGDAEKRARHFFGESGRVAQGVDAWRKGDLDAFGRLISQSGHSSIHNYECGSAPLIDLYHTLIETEGVYGARFSGAGFRGCCVALVDPTFSAAALETIHIKYRQKQPQLSKNASSFTCQPDDGARIL